MRPKHLVLYAAAALFLLFLAQNADLFSREKSFAVRFLAWRREVRPIAILLLLPAAGFLAGYLARRATEAAQRSGSPPSSAARRSTEADRDDEPPRLRRSAAPAPPPEAGA